MQRYPLEGQVDSHDSTLGGIRLEYCNTGETVSEQRLCCRFCARLPVDHPESRVFLEVRQKKAYRFPWARVRKRAVVHMES
jgi:hypothetical protein